MTIAQTIHSEKGGKLKKLFVASAAAILLSLTAVAPPSEAAVKGTRSIEVFHGIEYVGVVGYPARTQVKVDVLRGPNNVSIGSVTATTDGTGFLEIHHLGAGPFPGGDCWGPNALDPSAPNVTPDIRPGDTVQTTVLDNGVATDDIDSTVVRDIFINEDTAVDTAANTITMTGQVRSLPNAPIDVNADILELRMNAGGFTWDTSGRKDLREDVTAADFTADGDGDPTTFQHVFQLSGNVDAEGLTDADKAEASGFEQAFEWAGAASGTSELTVYDGTAGALGGCPPLAETAMTDFSHSVVNSGNVNSDMVVGGLAQDGVTGVDLTVGGNPYTATLNGGTWTATVPAADLNALPQGNFNIVANFAGDTAPQSQTKTIQKDTFAPAITANHPSGSTHNGSVDVALNSDGGEQVRYTTDGSAAGNNNSSLYNGQPINLSKTGTINAAATDAAGNRGEASFSYTVRQATALTLSGPAALNFGQAATLSGNLSSGGSALADKPVILEQRAAGSSDAFTQVGASQNTQANGGFSFTGIKPEANTEYRARFAEEAELQSKEVSKQVKVRALMSNNTATSNLKLGKVRNIVGKVSPSHAGKVIKVSIRRPGQPTLVRNVRLSDTSVYKFGYKANKVGLYRVSVQFAGDADHLGGKSVLKSFRVVR